MCMCVHKHTCLFTYARDGGATQVTKGQSLKSGRWRLWVWIWAPFLLTSGPGLLVTFLRGWWWCCGSRGLWEFPTRQPLQSSGSILTWQVLPCTSRNPDALWSCNSNHICFSSLGCCIKMLQTRWLRRTEKDSLCQFWRLDVWGHGAARVVPSEALTENQLQALPWLLGVCWRS